MAVRKRTRGPRGRKSAKIGNAGRGPAVAPTPAMWAKALQLLRAGIAGIAATASDVATLAVLVSVLHLDPRVANVPALVVGGVVNFLGNRHFAFRAQAGHVGKQAAGYTAVELVALALNGLLYDTVLRLVPAARPLYWLVRLATSHAVFLGWSYPLWGRVFRVQQLRGAR